MGQIDETYRVATEPNPSPTGNRKLTSELTLRLVTAAIGLPILGLVLYFGFWTVGVAAVAIAGLVGLETRDMAHRESRDLKSRVFFLIIGGMIPATAVLLAAIGDANDVDNVATVFGILAVAFLVETVITSRFRQVEFVRRNIVLGYGAFVVLALAMLPFLLTLPDGRELLTFCILVVFASDSGAYFIGKRFGRNRLAPNVSPGKTWEGLIGGVISAVAVAWLLGELLSLEFATARILVIGLLIAFASVIGDLGESWIKRLAGVKDSGVIVPGHGGIMDRLDALAPNFILIYFVDRWLG